MAKPQPGRRNDDLDPAVIDRNISPANPNSEAGRTARERDRTRPRDRDKVGDPARQEDER
jgi:hypothetical protein